MVYTCCEWLKDNVVVYIEHAGERKDILESTAGVELVEIGSAKVGLKIFLALHDDSYPRWFIYADELIIAESKLSYLKHWPRYNENIKVICDEQLQGV